MSDVQRYLREEEVKAYENAIKSGLHQRYRVLIKALEALSACRTLLEKHEWSYRPDLGIRDDLCWYCRSCDGLKSEGHAPNCVIAAQLKGTKGGK